MPRHTDKLANMAASARKARARNIKLAKLFSLIIVVAAAFVGGFAVRGDVELLDAWASRSSPAPRMRRRRPRRRSRLITRFRLA